MAYKRVYSLLVISTVLSGCGTLNMGQSSYYQISPPLLESSSNMSCNNMLVENRNGLVKRFYNPNEVKGKKIEKGDSIYISMLYSQFVGLSEGFQYSLMGEKAKAEIVILANVKEYDGATDFSNNSVDDARVIYYSDGVRVKGQPLNFTSIPVYGPYKYNGGLISIQLYVLEQDAEESKQFSSVLNKLASLGSLAYPQNSDLLGVLNDLGDSLISSSSTDDKEFSHFLVLHPSDGVENIQQATLQVGNFVIIKDDHPNNYPNSYPNDYSNDSFHYEDAIMVYDHENYCLNDSDGRLYVKKGDKYSLVDDKSYITFQVNKGYYDIAKNLESQQTYSELLNSQIDLINKNESIFNAGLSEVLKKTEQDEYYNEFVEYVETGKEYKISSIQSNTNANDANEVAKAKDFKEKALKNFKLAVLMLKKAIEANGIMREYQIQEALIELSDIIEKEDVFVFDENDFKERDVGWIINNYEISGF
jgi:hypothetical protein